MTSPPTASMPLAWLWWCVVLAALLLPEDGVAGSALPTAPPPSSECRVIVEASAAAIRFFVLTPNADDVNDVVVSEPIPPIARGLHSIAPGDAYSSMKESLHELSERHIGARPQTECPLYIIGTSGLRELPEPGQSDLYDAIYESYQADSAVNALLPLERSHLRTLSEDEENYFLTVAANFLDKRVGKDMEPASVQVYGILDLDPSSFRMSMDVEQRWRYNARKKSYHTAPLKPSEFFVHTFANTGANAIRDQVQQALAATNRSHNPCLLAGFPEPPAHEPVEVKSTSPLATHGDGRACMALVDSIVSHGNANCTKDEHCILLSYEQPQPSGTFYAIHDWFRIAETATKLIATSHPTIRIDFPSPSRYELEQAAIAVCGETYEAVSTAFLDSTNASEDKAAAAKASLPWTCLHLSYVTVLLKQLGFTDDERRVLYVETIHDRPVHWVVGAHLKMETDRRVVYEAALGEYLSSQVDLGLPVGYNLSLLVLAFAVLALYVLVDRASGRDGTTALQFVHDATQ